MSGYRIGNSEFQRIGVQELMGNKGILTTIRASRGQDIYAACGLLSTKELAATGSEN